MGFMKPKTPKPQPVPDPVTVDESKVDATLRDREAKRQGFAAALLTGEKGLAGRPLTTATKRLLGG